MKILFDQGTPAPLRAHLASHTVDTAYELGWAVLQNSQLLQAAEEAGYDLSVTTDQNLTELARAKVGRPCPPFYFVAAYTGKCSGNWSDDPNHASRRLQRVRPRMMKRA